MGCITSANKLHHDNVFRVRVAHLQPSAPGTPIIRSGYLELTPRELIFLTPGCEPIVWALQHLRRYGLNGDLFSFEAGRRCMSGPGIYTFRVQNANSLYPMFQRYINAVNTDAFAQVERERVDSTHSVLLGRTDANPHSNNYLEPAPLLARANVPTSLPDATPELSDSPDDAPPTAAVLTEDGTLQSPITPGAYINTNVYFDQPLRAFQETTAPTASMPATANGTSSAFSTMRRRTLLKGCSLDMPPQESAPVLGDNLHMYANVDTPSSCSLRDRLLFELPSNERCYENINRLDLPLLLKLPTTANTTAAASGTMSGQQQQQAPPQRDDSQQSVASLCTTQPPPPPATPTSSLGGGTSGVNYIVLDLDMPRSPAQSSPKALSNGFGSGLSLSTSTTHHNHHHPHHLQFVGGNNSTTAQTAPVTPETTTTTITSLDALPLSAQSMSSVAGNNNDTSTKAATESTLGYSTIDFIRTYALNKSSTAPPHGNEPPLYPQNHHPHEAEELRITRHSKCVRKAYSISE